MFRFDCHLQIYIRRRAFALGQFSVDARAHHWYTYRSTCVNRTHTTQQHGGT